MDKCSSIAGVDADFGANACVLLCCKIASCSSYYQSLFSWSMFNRSAVMIMKFSSLSPHIVQFRARSLCLAFPSSPPTLNHSLSFLDRGGPWCVPLASGDSGSGDALHDPLATTGTHRRCLLHLDLLHHGSLTPPLASPVSHSHWMQSLSHSSRDIFIFYPSASASYAIWRRQGRT
jgi:hypothetical protein